MDRYHRHIAGGARAFDVGVRRADADHSNAPIDRLRGPLAERGVSWRLRSRPAGGSNWFDLAQELGSRRIARFELAVAVRRSVRTGVLGRFASWPLASLLFSQERSGDVPGWIANPATCTPASRHHRSVELAGARCARLAGSSLVLQAHWDVFRRRLSRSLGSRGDPDQRGDRSGHGLGHLAPTGGGVVGGALLHRVLVRFRCDFLPQARLVVDDSRARLPPARIGGALLRRRGLLAVPTRVDGAAWSAVRGPGGLFEALLRATAQFARPICFMNVLRAAFGPSLSGRRLQAPLARP